ncbi:MAG: hypothetical protein IKR25_13735 [Muribaculaceae bacterium]|nr:hypothetical protein [Muribaculaceae bacterium]
MKKVFVFVLVPMFAALLLACGGNDEPAPVKTDEVTRVKDGNGKVFLENGVLVDAHIDYTAAELSAALTEHEWTFDYAFYYDNTHVSAKREELAAYCPTHIHADGTMEFNHYLPDARIRDITVKGKELTVTARLPIYSSTYIPTETYVVVAFNLNGEGDGLMIIDKKLATIALEDYDANSSYIRMVWRTTPDE